MALNGALLGACCFQVAAVITQISSEILEPSPLDPVVPARIERSADTLASVPNAILERNLFGAQLSGDAQVSDDVVVNEPVAATKLPLRLLGTAAATEESRSRAAIEDEKTKKHMVVAVGDRVEGHDRVRVTAIERTRVILDNAGRSEELALHEDDPRRQPAVQPRRVASRAPRVPRREAQESLNSRLEALAGDDGEGINRILSSARIVPYYADGQMQGMKVDNIKANSVFEKIGLQNGDVISEVNGIVVDQLDATSSIFEEIATADPIEITALRGEETVKMSASAADLMEQP
jgi:general secretion pathway protein C